jgi:uncharacterized protein
MAREIERSDEIRDVLASARTIAVLGAHCASARPACYVPTYLKNVGYKVIPVNPLFEGEALFGEPTRGLLADIEEPVDIVDVFRRAEAIPEHIEDILAMDPRPRLVWFQQGIVNDAAAARLVAEGIDVVQDRCTLADHRRFGLPHRAR